MRQRKIDLVKTFSMAELEMNTRVQYWKQIKTKHDQFLIIRQSPYLSSDFCGTQ